MKFGILGTGIVGRTLAGRLIELGHQVVIGTRDVAETLARTQPDQMGTPPIGEWLQHNPQARLGAFAEAAAFGEMLINATNGWGTLEALKLAGEANLSGKILMDISNPLDFSKGMPPTLFVKDNDSLAEQIQRAFPAIKVVKTLNSMTAQVMIHPVRVANGDHTVFVSGEGRRHRPAAHVWLERYPGPGRHHHGARRRNAVTLVAASDGRASDADV